MTKTFLPLILLPLLLAGCTTTSVTNLTPKQHERNDDGLYSLEAALTSRQATIRWDTIKPYAVVGTEFYPMEPVSRMTNRWETVVPVPAGTSEIFYRFRFDYDYNAIPSPRNDSLLSPEYKLKIVDK